MPLAVVDGPTIEAGESLSDAVDCSAGRVIRITIPGPEEWREANLTFQVSSDNSGFSDVFNEKGEEVMVSSAPYWSTIVLSGIHLDSVGWVKIRSGTRDNPVPQPNRCHMGITLQVV